MSPYPVSKDPSAGAKAHASIDAAGLTSVGRERTGNEDAYLIATLQRSMIVHDARPEDARGWFAGGSAGTLLVVADGMGGEGGGDVASRVAVNTVASYLLNFLPWVPAPSAARAPRDASSPGIRDQLASALVIGDSTVKTEGARTGTPLMATTLTMALVLWPMLYVAHVGDTRCYLLHSGQLSRLTTDHTMAQRLAEGAADPIDPASHLHHILWNYLGGREQLLRPQIAKLGLDLGDVLLLCSDGLTKHVADEQIAQLLSAEEPSSRRCERLVALANAEGGSDNVTVVVANARAAPDLPPERDYHVSRTVAGGVAAERAS
jgi:serine/threonine protein phosphatase PrpC